MAEPVQRRNFRLIDYAGSLSGNSTNFTLANVSSTAGTTRQTFSVDTSAAHQVNLDDLRQAPAASLTWVGGSNSNAWDVHSTINWTGAPGPSPDNHFYNGDSVSFTDTGSTTPVINVSGAIAPGAVTFSNSAGHTYKISGQDIAVAADLTTSGTGDVTFVNGALTVAGNVNAGGAGGTLSITNSGATTFSGNVTSSGSRGLVIANTGGNPVVVGGALNFGGSGGGSISNNNGHDRRRQSDGRWIELSQRERRRPERRRQFQFYRIRRHEFHQLRPLFRRKPIAERNRHCNDREYRFADVAEFGRSSPAARWL